jgi:hypothetical protein
VNVFANTEDRAQLAQLTSAWLGQDSIIPQEDANVLNELARLGILSAEERARVFIEHACVEHGVIHICDFNESDAKSTWLEVRPDGTCSVY